MIAPYSNVPDRTCDEVTTYDSSLHTDLAPGDSGLNRTTRFTLVGLLVLGLVGSVLALLASPARGPLRGASLQEKDYFVVKAEADPRGLLLVEKAAPKCVKLWGQCGGFGYTGPTCCEHGSECEHHPLLEYSSYHQCRKPGSPACGEVVPDSQCAKMMHSLKWDVERTPENFKGLWTGMDDKEYQMYSHWGIYDESHCPEPCADSTCFVVLHLEGCDSLDTWYCSEDDGSLKFACCCKYFNEDKSLEKPVDVDADMANAMVDNEGPSLFCTAMVRPGGYELGLLQAQYANEWGKLGLFACDLWSVYSNESLRLNPEEHSPEIMTTLMNGSLSAKVGGDWSTALNTEVFIKFWDMVINDRKAWKCDWVVKIDPDAVWIPSRLRALLRTSHGPLGQPEPPEGFWLNNCYLGLHGPIEVLSRKALHTYNSSQERCQHGEVSTIGQEDRFIRKCFAKLGIKQVDAYNLLLESDFACGEIASTADDKPPCFSPQVAFHPFKSITTWLRCHTQAANHPWALPVIPVTDSPSDANGFHTD